VTDTATIDLLPMDYALLAYLIEHGGDVPAASIPAKIFRGEIPEGFPNLIDLGVIEHKGELTCITDAGRRALASKP
jgi:hypothetical protein